MNAEDARREFPIWASAPLHEQEVEILPFRMRMENKIHVLKKRFGIVVIATLGLMVWTVGTCIVTGTIVRRNTTAEVQHEMQANFAEYLKQQENERVASQLLTGEASREKAINSAIDAVAPVISKLSTDKQKLTEAGCMLARVLNPAFPNSFEEVAEQPQQWMFYDGTDKTCTTHDRELAEQIIRPYMEDGIIPSDLTAKHVYGTWTQSDYWLRDDYYKENATDTWRYHG